MTDHAATPIAWTEGRWTTAPAHHVHDGSDLVATAIEGSDAWRKTSYGFVHDSEHSLLRAFTSGSAIEVTFTADFSEQFDQAGLMLKADERHWIKTGVEFADGVAQVGAVVTNEYSDWSAAPVPDWSGRRVTVRASWSVDAVTIRARADDEPFRFVRLAPMLASSSLEAGPFLAAPTRSGLSVRFHSWVITEADGSLH